MKSGPVLILVGSLVLAGATQAAPQHAHEHHAAHAQPSAEPTAPAQRWEADVDLREGMRRVRAALDDLRHHEMGHMPAQMAVERAVAVEDAITYMFTHCELAPEPDAALHRILVPLLGAAKRLQADTTDLAAVKAMRDAVAAYPRDFDDPEWTTAAPDADGH